MKNYQQAQEILERIKAANKILLALHRSPDPDSIGSNLAMFYFLNSLGKDVRIFSCDKPDQELSFLNGFDRIEQKDVAVENLKVFDLLLLADCAIPQMLTRSENFNLPEGLQIVNIDHHITNPNFGTLNLIDGEIGSTSEILYNLLTAWDINIDKDIASCLLTGIIGDTGCFRYPSGTTPQTLRAGADLLEKGASLYEIVLAIYQTTPVDMLKYWAKVLDKFEVRTSGQYTYCFCFLEPKDVNRWPKNVRSGAVGMFFQSVEGTNFGTVVEIDEQGVVSGGFRSRTNVDVAKLAEALGGGGHRAASGFSFKVAPGDTQGARKKVLDTIDAILGNEFA